MIGLEFLVQIGANPGAQAQALQFIGQPHSFTTVGTVPAEVLANGYRVSVPLTLLNNDDSRLNFKVTVSVLLDPMIPSFIGILDYMPNLGLPPGMVQ